MFNKDKKALRKWSYILLAVPSIALSSGSNANYFDKPEETEERKVVQVKYRLAQEAWEKLKSDAKNTQKVVVQTSLYTPEKHEDIINEADIKRKNIFQ